MKVFPSLKSPSMNATPSAAICPAILMLTLRVTSAFPRINPAEEMVDLMSASRGYQANVAAITAVKEMIAKSIEIFR